MPLIFVLLASSIAIALAQGGTCDSALACTYSLNVAGSSYSFNFRPLCNAVQDYQLNDAVGHTYYANICGKASQNCLPAGWFNQYEYGVTIQTWGTAPEPCDKHCEECNAQGVCTPACCTADCQVIAVGAPTIGLVVPGDITKGVVLTYQVSALFLLFYHNLTLNRKTRRNN
jgi:hypothetical protein